MSPSPPALEPSTAAPVGRTAPLPIISRSVPDQLLNLLKLFLLVLLYLFFLRVLRAVWTEVNVPRLADGAAPVGRPKGRSRRAAGCQVPLEDAYASQVHARVFQRDGNWFVEDLGSTNGTYLNRRKVTGPMQVQRGDKLQIGNTVLELGS